MSSNNDIDRLIDDFILGRLGEEEAQEFQKRLEYDHELSAQVKLRVEMKNGLEAFGRKTLKEDLKRIHKKVTSSNLNPTKTKNRKLVYGVIVVLLLMLIALLSWWFMNHNTKPDPPKLYATYFKAYDLTDMRRSDANEDLIRMGQLYRDKNYESVLPMINAHLDTLRTKPSSWLLAAGVSLMELGKSEEALSKFQQITTNQDFNFEDEVRWYSALAYLKLGNTERAKSFLTPLTEDKQADHHKEALSLMRNLD